MSSKELKVVISGVDQLSPALARMMTSLAAQFDKAKAKVAPLGAAFDLTFGKAISAGEKAFSVLTSIKTLMIGVGAAVLANKFVGWVVDSVHELDEFGERARQLGVLPEWLSAAEFAAKKANVPFEEIADTMRKMVENLQAGLHDHSGAVAVLDRLGIAAADVHGELRPVADLIDELTAKTAGLGQAERLGIYKEIGGKGGQALERLTAGGNLAAQAADLRTINGIITSSQVEAASKLDDAMDRVAIAWRGIKYQMVEVVAEPVAAALNLLSQQIGQVPDALRGASSLFTAWAKSPSSLAGQGAKEQLMEVLESGGKLLYEVIVGAFNVGWAVVTGGAVTLMAWLGPKLTDVLEMAVHKATPWLKGEPERQRYYDDLGQLELNRRRLAQFRTGSFDRSSADNVVNGSEAATARYFTPAGIATWEAIVREAEARLAPVRKRIEAEDSLIGDTMLSSMKDTIKSAQDATAEMHKNVSAAFDDFAARGRALAAIGVASRTQRLGFGDLRVMEGAGENSPVVAPWHPEFSTPDMQPPSVYQGERDRQAAIVRLGQELNERMMRSTGRDAEADRAKLLADQAVQIKQLEELSLAGSTYHDQMVEVQRIELLRADTFVKLAPLMKEAEKAQNRYNDEVAQYQLMSDEGLIGKGLLKADTINATRTLSDKLADIKAKMAAIVGAAPELGSEFSDQLDKIGQSADEAGRKVKRLLGDENKSYLDGVERGWIKWGGTMQTVSQLGEESITKLADGLSNGIGDGFVDAISGAKSFEDAMRGMASSVLHDIASMTARWASFQLVSGIGSAVFGGAGSAAAGGSGFAFDGAGSGKSRSVGSLAPAQSFGYAPVSGKGGSGGGITLAPVFYITVKGGADSKQTGEQIGKSATQAMLAELEVNSGARNKLKGYMA